MSTDPAWLRSAVGAADASFQALGLYESFSHEAFISDPTGGRGEPDYAAPEVLQGRVIRKEGSIPTPDGKAFRYRAAIGFMAPVAIDPKDRIRLRDGMTGPIYTAQGGLLDPSSGLPFARTVYLG